MDFCVILSTHWQDIQPFKPCRCICSVIRPAWLETRQSLRIKWHYLLWKGGMDGSNVILSFMYNSVSLSMPWENLFVFSFYFKRQLPPIMLRLLTQINECLYLWNQHIRRNSQSPQKSVSLLKPNVICLIVYKKISNHPLCLLWGLQKLSSPCMSDLMIYNDCHNNGWIRNYVNFLVNMRYYIHTLALLEQYMVYSVLNLHWFMNQT